MTKPLVPHVVPPCHEFDSELYARNQVRLVKRQTAVPDPVRAMTRKRQAELELMADLERELLG